MRVVNVRRTSCSQRPRVTRSHYLITVAASYSSPVRRSGEPPARPWSRDLRNSIRSMPTPTLSSLMCSWKTAAANHRNQKRPRAGKRAFHSLTRSSLTSTGSFSRPTVAAMRFLSFTSSIAMVSSSGRRHVKVLTPSSESETRWRHSWLSDPQKSHAPTHPLPPIDAKDGCYHGLNKRLAPT